MKIHFFALTLFLFLISFTRGNQATRPPLSQASLTREARLTKPICPEDESCQLPSPRSHDVLEGQLIAGKAPICIEDEPCYIRRFTDTPIQIQTPVEGFIFYNDSPQFIRWVAVPGVTSYGVSIQQNGKNIWETIVDTTEITYPKDLLLKSENSYQLTIQAIGNDRQGNLTFRMLNEEATQRIFSEANNILIHPDTSEVEKALELASLYSDNYLFGEAIKVLLSAVEKDSSSIKVHQRLGNLYLSSQQPDSAKIHYEQSLTLASNLEQEADANFGLGMVNMYEENLEEAIRLLLMAQHDYEEIGEEESVDKIKKLLAEIQ